MDLAVRRPGVLPAAAAGTGLLVLLPSLLVGVPAVLAVMLAVASAGALTGIVALLRPRLESEDDPLAPLAIERWLCENDDDWPWLVLGGVTAFVGLLLVTSPRVALPMLLLGGLIAAIPALRRVLDGCGRIA